MGNAVKPRVLLFSGFVCGYFSNSVNIFFLFFRRKLLSLILDIMTTLKTAELTARNMEMYLPQTMRGITRRKGKGYYTSKIQGFFYQEVNGGAII